MKTEYEIDVWFAQLSYIDKLSLYEGRSKVGVE